MSTEYNNNIHPENDTAQEFRELLIKWTHHWHV